MWNRFSTRFLGSFASANERARALLRLEDRRPACHGRRASGPPARREARTRWKRVCHDSLERCLPTVNAYERFVRPPLFTLDADAESGLSQATSTEHSTK